MEWLSSAPRRTAVKPTSLTDVVGSCRLQLLPAALGRPLARPPTGPPAAAPSIRPSAAAPSARPPARPSVSQFSAVCKPAGVGKAERVVIISHVVAVTYARPFARPSVDPSVRPSAHLQRGPFGLPTPFQLLGDGPLSGCQRVGGRSAERSLITKSGR